MVGITSQRNIEEFGSSTLKSSEMVGRSPLKSVESIISTRLLSGLVVSNRWCLLMNRVKRGDYVKVSYLAEVVFTEPLLMVRPISSEDLLSAVPRACVKKIEESGWEMEGE